MVPHRDIPVLLGWCLFAVAHTGCELKRGDDSTQEEQTVERGALSELRQDATKPVLPVDMLDLQLESTTLQINGSPGRYMLDIHSRTHGSIGEVAVQAWIVQGETRRAAGGRLVQCGGALGELRPGRCQIRASFSASDKKQVVGGGPFLAGDAKLVVELKVSGPETAWRPIAQEVPITLIVSAKEVSQP